MLSETLLLNGVYNFSTVVLLIVFSLFSYPPQTHTSPLFARDIVAKRYMPSPSKGPKSLWTVQIIWDGSKLFWKVQTRFF